MVWRGSPSQTVNLPVYLLLGIGLVVSTAGLLFLRAGTAPSATTDVDLRSVYPWIIVAIWVLCGVGALVSYLKVSTTKYVLTSERLRVTTGVLSTRTEDLELRRVRDSIILRPLWARMAGLGDVQILSADASTPRATCPSHSATVPARCSDTPVRVTTIAARAVANSRATCWI